jgi:hypothetical protein
MVNSIALEGDGYNICSVAEVELIEISSKLNFSQEQVQGSSKCGWNQKLHTSIPVLLKHYLFYQINDANCSREDAASSEERITPFKEK